MKLGSRFETRGPRKKTKIAVICKYSRVRLCLLKICVFTTWRSLNLTRVKGGQGTLRKPQLRNCNGVRGFRGGRPKGGAGCDEKRGGREREQGEGIQLAEAACSRRIRRLTCEWRTVQASLSGAW